MRMTKELRGNVWIRVTTPTDRKMLVHVAHLVRVDTWSEGALLYMSNDKSSIAVLESVDEIEALVDEAAAE